MNRPDLAALRRNAEAAIQAEDAVIAASGQHREDLWTASHDAQRAFHDEADPTTILALLDELEALRAQPVAQTRPVGFVDHGGSVYWYNPTNTPPADTTELYAAPPAPSSAGLIEAARKGMEALELAIEYVPMTPGGQIDEATLEAAIAALRAALGKEEAK